MTTRRRFHRDVAVQAVLLQIVDHKCMLPLSWATCCRSRSATSDPNGTGFQRAELAFRQFAVRVAARALPAAIGCSCFIIVSAYLAVGPSNVLAYALFCNSCSPANMLVRGQCFERSSPRHQAARFHAPASCPVPSASRGAGLCFRFVHRRRADQRQSRSTHVCLIDPAMFLHKPDIVRMGCQSIAFNLSCGQQNARRQ
jgi:hypothetical protein